jgi:hypothetical protein
MAVPHVDGDRPNKRWGAEVAFDDLDAIVADPSRLERYRERIVSTGRAAAARLRSSDDDQ